MRVLQQEHFKNRDTVWNLQLESSLEEVFLEVMHVESKVFHHLLEVKVMKTLSCEQFKI